MTGSLDTDHSEVELRAFRRLCRIVSNVSAFSEGGASERRLFCEQAGVLAVLGPVVWSSAGETVAGVVVSRVNKYGPLDGRPRYYALGSLCDYLLTLSEVPGEDRAFVAGLIVKCILVLDPLYLRRLAAEHSVLSLPEPPEREIAQGVQGSWDHFLDVARLWDVHYAAQAVARIEVPDGEPAGTGFLVGPDLLLTSQHVLPSRAALDSAVARFTYQLSLPRQHDPQPPNAFSLDPDFYYSSPEAELDYALVRLRGEPLGDVAAGREADGPSARDLVLAGKHRGYLLLEPRLINVRERVNIIQHPGGGGLKAVLTNNHVLQDTEPASTRVYYETSTDEGSSGAPALSMMWRVVALHKGRCEGVPVQPGAAGRVESNVGVPIGAILGHLKTSSAADPKLAAALAGLQQGF